MIYLEHLTKSYAIGSQKVPILKEISLKIESGEFVAIMGPSGSGKSTLLNILGLLDTPDTGSYTLNNIEVAHLEDHELAALRHEALGFVFQKFHLLPRVSALENVALPLIYSPDGYDLGEAKKKLDAVGLGHRHHHRPNELSGGEQQRVAIARALINDPKVIIADEPTGNLDSKSEADIMGILTQLNQQGKTIVMVTHEPEIANYAHRIITVRDGQIISDTKTSTTSSVAILKPSRVKKDAIKFGVWVSWLTQCKQSFQVILANKLRSALSVLGIMIGVGAVIAMVSIGLGAQEAISKQLASLGSNLLNVRSGGRAPGGVSLGAGAITRLSIPDADALRALPMIKRVSPYISGRAQVVFFNKNWQTQIQGVGLDYADMRAAHPEYGRFFTQEELTSREKVALLGTTVSHELFGETSGVGKMIRLNRIPFKVIGLLPSKGANSWRDQDDVILIPITTAMYRVLGKDYLDAIDVEVISEPLIPAAQAEIERVMRKRHRVAQSALEPFQIRNMAEVQEALTATTQTMGVLLGVIAGISLLVGGIGIMNMMLVSVTERTREIGLRKSIGAKKSDIIRQFLIESVVLTTLGGVLGIILGVGSSLLLATLSGWAIKISLLAVGAACIFSIVVGVIFGLWPAYQAAKLRPADALRYE